MKSFLNSVVWSTSENRFDTGRGDTSVHTDVNAWGVLALGASGTYNYVDGLSFNQSCCESTQSNSRATLNGFDFDGDSNVKGLVTVPLRPRGSRGTGLSQFANV